MGVRVREKKKGSGEYWVFINHNGRRRSLKVGKLDVANEVADQLQVKLKDNPDEIFKEREKPKPTFKVMSKQWLAKVVKAAKDSTIERYTQVLDSYVLPAAGLRRVDEIRKSTIADAIEEAQDEGLSVATLELIRTCFSGPLELAAFKELIPANPAHGILKQMGISRKNDKKRKAADRVKFMTPEQVNLFLTTCETEYYEFFLFLFMTGTRLGEALAVTWPDINWKEKTVEIKKAFRRDLGTTKTGAERSVDLPDVLIDKLKRLQTQRKKDSLKTGTKVPDIIFHRKGTHMKQNQARRVFKRTLVEAKLPEHRLHNTRHTYASMMLKNGASLDYVKRMMGHTDIAMTSNVYGHLMPDRDRTQVNLLGDTLLNPHPTRTPEIKKP